MGEVPQIQYVAKGGAPQVPEQPMALPPTTVVAPTVRAGLPPLAVETAPIHTGGSIAYSQPQMAYGPPQMAVGTVPIHTGGSISYSQQQMSVETAPIGTSG